MGMSTMIKELKTKLTTLLDKVIDDSVARQLKMMQVRDFEVLKTSFGVSIDDIVCEQSYEWTGTFHYQGALNGYRKEESWDSEGDSKKVNSICGI